MKFFNFKKFISVTLCLMLVLDIAFAFEVKSRSYKSKMAAAVKRVKKASSRVVTPTDTLMSEIYNLWGRLTIGALEEMITDSTVFSKCIPKEWMTEKNDPDESAYLEKKFNGLSDTLMTILQGVGKVLQYFCHPVDNTIDSIVSLVGWVFKANNGHAFIEGKYKLKRFRTRGALWNWLLLKVTSLGKWAADQLKAVWNVVSDYVKDMLSGTYDKIIDFMTKILGFFTSQYFDKIMSTLNCLAKNTFMNNLYDKFLAMGKKIANIHTFVSVNSYLAKLFWSLVCDWDKFTKSVTYAVAASNATEGSDKYYFWGRFIGSVISAVGNVDATRKRFRRKFK